MLPCIMHDELSEDYRDMIFNADTASEVETRWHRRLSASMRREMQGRSRDSLAEAGDKLFSLHAPVQEPMEISPNDQRH